MKMQKGIKLMGGLLLIGLILTGCAGSSGYMLPATPPQGVAPGKALVYFMRPSGFGFAINFQIWDGDHFVGLSQAKSYFGYECDAGKHLFIGIAENKQALDAELEAGKIYYAITRVTMGAWKARVDFIPVTRGSEFWDTVEAYKKGSNFIAAKEDERAKWEAAKKLEAQKYIAFFNSAEGKAFVRKLNKEDGR